MLYMRFKYRPAPPDASEVKPWMYKLSVFDHVALYVLILLVCASGYLSSAHTRWDTSFWWTIDFPRIAAPDEDMNMFFSTIHTTTCWMLLAVLAAHISGALYHAFRNDSVVRRMLRL